MENKEISGQKKGIEDFRLKSGDKSIISNVLNVLNMFNNYFVNKIRKTIV